MRAASTSRSTGAPDRRGRGRRAGLVVGCGAVLLLASSAPALGAATRAGVAAVDATWHVGASAGQFTDDTGPTGADGIDPHGHSSKKRISDGVALRTSTRAIVVEDTEGDRVAIVANDLYLPQDLLTRRVASLLAEHDRDARSGAASGPVTGIGPDNLAVTASHNHNTPYYSTPGWGTAIFQDVIDLRFYEYMAQRMARAVIRASAGLVPVRMGGASRAFDGIQSHTYGPKVGDDGTPAGQPWSHTTGQVSVVRLDDMSRPGRPRPMANWVVFGVHPEWTWGYDLINGDITHAAARIVDRELGTVSVFSQRETGTSGPHKDTRVHPPDARREYQDMGFGQLDRGARRLADAIKATVRDIDRGSPQRSAAYQPYVENFDVATVSQRFAPPATRPYPGVSNCNTASLFHGDPRLPILGLPDCESVPGNPAGPLTPFTSQMYDQLKAAGVPIPESYSATKLTAVEETAAVHLMAIRLGDIAATICPCEQFTDTALNIESRLDRVAGNLHTGFDWTQGKTPAGRDWCVPADGDGWRCADPRDPTTDLDPVSDLAYRRMKAQIHNDARGWETDAATIGGEAEPADPAEIKGNFTHEEHREHGYRLVLSVGMGNDYWGYVPEYREYRSHDHYRKALSGLGPHGADFLATRLARLAAFLNGGAPVELTPLDQAFLAEQARAEGVSDGLGTLARQYTRAYESQLPADGGPPRITEQPEDVARFDAAHVRFVGGSNYTDLPQVAVERREGGSWVPYGDMTGDVQLMVDFPKQDELGAWRSGEFDWRWTAAFEAFTSDVAQPDAARKRRPQTPPGAYRFVIAGEHRAAAGEAARPYRLVSRRFEVTPWPGITVLDMRLEDDRTVSFGVGPVNQHDFETDNTYTVGPIDYPDAYESPFRFLDGKRRLYAYGLDDPSEHQQYCPRCTFRPWLDVGDVKVATVTFLTADGSRRRAGAVEKPNGRWRTPRAVPARGAAVVGAGCVRDGFGNFNGKASSRVPRGGGAPAGAACGVAARVRDERQGPGRQPPDPGRNGEAPSGRGDGPGGGSAPLADEGAGGGGGDGGALPFTGFLALALLVLGLAALGAGIVLRRRIRARAAAGVPAP